MMKPEKHPARLSWDNFIPFCLWHIWLNRNNNVHNNKSESLNYAYVYGQAIEFTHFITHRRRTTTLAQHLSVKWENPNRGKYKPNVDGARV